MSFWGMLFSDNHGRVAWPGHETQKGSLPRGSLPKDKAGVSAIERAYLWSQIAKEGEVNEPIHSMLKVAWQGRHWVGVGAHWQRNSNIFRHAS